MSNAKIWVETVTIPTYGLGKPEKNPMFLERRTYQGSSGKVYPFPVTEMIEDEKHDEEYEAVFLENEYIKVMVLPQLGGRIQRAYDKTNGYDFVYYNHVIKPALVGLIGPWISGGIEFNWPQHHRPSTFLPVDYSIKENADGSVTVFISEIDRMYGTKGMAQISVYPGKAYIEIKGKLFNRTDLPQTFLWWANPAVPVNDYTRSIFPPDVTAVMDHGKRAVSSFPIATGEYYKQDYSAGVDISMYKNIKVPTSYMAAHSDYNFIGNYDENVEAGLLHVADHHFSPGKKQWTWGNDDFGRTWDKNLTDADGPYIELMTGVFTDNQPDFTWLHPHEEKNFTQYFMPYKKVGRVANATKEAAIGITVEEPKNVLSLRVYATGVHKNAEISVSYKGEQAAVYNVDLTPETCFEEKVVLPEGADGSKDVVVCVKDGVELVSYKSFVKKPEPLPTPADALPAPDQVKSNEQLYFAGQHLEQYRHAAFEPADYYLEGLKRDPYDSRINQAYGELLLRRGRIEESVPYFEAAIKAQNWKNTNPYSGKASYFLGLAQELLNQTDKAFDSYYKSIWSGDMQNPSFYALACLASRKGAYEEALQFCDEALIRNWHDMKTRTLKAVLLGVLGMDAAAFCEESLAIDPLCFGILNETDPEAAAKAMRGTLHNHQELALEYIRAGFYEKARAVLDGCTETFPAEGGDASPMIGYYKAYTYLMEGSCCAAAAEIAVAEQKSGIYCFPNRIEEVVILKACIDASEKAPMAAYYLGSLYYDKKQHDLSIALWEKTIAEKPDFAMAHRNLSIAYYNHTDKQDDAFAQMKIARELEPKNARFLLEYDQLSQLRSVSVEERLAEITADEAVAWERDDLILRKITLLNCLGRYKEAEELLAIRKFHPWEGGEGRVITQYKLTKISLAKQAIAEGRFEEAKELLESTFLYPDNLGEGKLPNVNDHETYYYLGLALKGLGKEEEAKQALTMATIGDETPGTVLYYNDQPADYIFFMGLAYRELGRELDALRCFHKLEAFGEQHVFDKVSADYFAVSLPELDVFMASLADKNVRYCKSMEAYGRLGLGQYAEAKKLAEEVLATCADAQDADKILRML